MLGLENSISRKKIQFNIPIKSIANTNKQLWILSGFSAIWSAKIFSTPIPSILVFILNYNLIWKSDLIPNLGLRLAALKTNSTMLFKLDFGHILGQRSLGSEVQN